MKRALCIIAVLVILVSALVASQVQAKPNNQPTLSPAAAEETTRVSVASDGTEGSSGSLNPSISADGRYVAFESYAWNLVSSDYNSSTDIFVHDRETGQTTPVSVASDGTLGNNDSHNPAISADGSYVTFFSNASNLVTGDTNNFADVFVHDRETGQTTRVSVSSDGTQANNHSSGYPAISADGHYVAFVSWASNLISGDTNDEGDIYVHDCITGETLRASVSSDGTQGNSKAFNPSISADGRYVAFDTYANNLVSGDSNGTSDIFVHDQVTGETELVTVASDGTQGNGPSFDPAISADGRFVAFVSIASNLVDNDANDRDDVFVYDRMTGETRRASIASNGGQGNQASERPAISADGRYIGFYSYSNNLVSGDTYMTKDVFIHDLITGQTTMVSVASDGTQANDQSDWPSISADGRFVAFYSYATNLVSGDTNDFRDVFVHERTTYDVSVIPTADGASGTPGDTIDYTLVVTNTGNIVDTFNIAVSGNAWTTSAPASVGPLAPSASQVVDVSVTVPPEAVIGNTDVVTITLTSQGDNTKSAVSTLTSTVSNVYGLTVEPATDAKECLPGDTVVYTLAVTNTGNTADTFAVVVSGNAWTTNAPATVGPLAAGAGQLVNVSVTVPTSVTGGGADTATITLTSQGDNTKSDITTLTTTAIAIDADLEVSISGSPDPVVIGGSLTYTIVVTNHGPADATNVLLTDNLPAGVVYVSDDSGCSHTAGVVTCNLGGIANGASRTVQIVVNVTATGALENTASATADQPDPSPGNNSDTTTIQAEYRKIYLPMIQR
jgi:uncharacterized repeat protein (TIGR01451 family)